MEANRKVGYYWIAIGKHAKIAQWTGFEWMGVGSDRPISTVYISSVGAEVLPENYDTFILGILEQEKTKRDQEMKVAKAKFMRMAWAIKISVWIAAVIGTVSIITSIIKIIRCR